jgi:ferric-dicitrate binding protein FerR (iron transport regulator)
MIAGTGKVAVVGGSLLVTEGGADAAVHVQHHRLHRAAAMHDVDPASRQVGQRHQVLGPGQHLCLKAPHLLVWTAPDGIDVPE